MTFLLGSILVVILKPDILLERGLCSGKVLFRPLSERPIRATSQPFPIRPSPNYHLATIFNGDCNHPRPQTVYR